MYIYIFFMGGVEEGGRSEGMRDREIQHIIFLLGINHQSENNIIIQEGSKRADTVVHQC